MARNLMLKSRSSRSAWFPRDLLRLETSQLCWSSSIPSTDKTIAGTTSPAASNHGAGPGGEENNRSIPSVSKSVSLPRRLPMLKLPFVRRGKLASSRMLGRASSSCQGGSRGATHLPLQRLRSDQTQTTMQIQSTAQIRRTTLHQKGWCHRTGGYLGTAARRWSEWPAHIKQCQIVLSVSGSSGNIKGISLTSLQSLFLRLGAFLEFYRFASPLLLFSIDIPSIITNDLTTRRRHDDTIYESLLAFRSIKHILITTILTISRIFLPTSPSTTARRERL